MTASYSTRSWAECWSTMTTPSGRLVHDVAVEHLEQRDARSPAGRLRAGAVGRAPAPEARRDRCRPRSLAAREPGGRTATGTGRQSPTGAAATSAPSASRTASSTTRSTPIRSRKRTSSLAGWTFTSTSSGATSMSQVERGPVAGMDGGAVAGLRRADQERILERPAVDEELGSPAGRLGVARALDEPGDPERAGGVAAPAPACRRARVPTPRRAAPPASWPGGHDEPAGAVHVQLEADLGVGQREGGHRPRAPRGSRWRPSGEICGGRGC